MSATEADRAAAHALWNEVLCNGGVPGWTATEAVAAALAAEREKARAPFLALADDLDADAKRADDAEPVKMDDLLRMITAARVTRHAAGRIRRAAEDAP